ncbi:hypothetical protein CRG98_007287 [Punica granatum]|uniref:Uncharacterized protein n=1 Tax=Punica granatum TaxID=22663 RepID=A0A2I0KV09_PUNGR|nr:hypothetical protein CRG98_007287 [Punica granatum]
MTQSNGRNGSLGLVSKGVALEKGAWEVVAANGNAATIIVGKSSKVENKFDPDDSSAKNFSDSSVEELHSDSNSSIEARRLNASTTTFLSATPLRKSPVARHPLPRLKQLISRTLPR